MKIFSVFDVKSNTFFPPFAMDTEANAIRSFADLACEANNFICRYPADFYLCYVSDFDPATGDVSFSRPGYLSGPVRILSAADAQRIRRGGAVGGTGPVPPEDSSASAERNNGNEVSSLPSKN